MLFESIMLRQVANLYTNLTFVCLSVRAGGHRKSQNLVGFSVAFLNAETVRYEGDGMVENAWINTAYSCDVRYREHTGQG